MENQNQPSYVTEMEEKSRLAREDFIENLRSLTEPHTQMRPATTAQSAVDAARGAIKTRQ